MVIGSDVIDLLRRDFPVEYDLDWNHKITTPAYDEVLGPWAINLHRFRVDSKNTVYLYDGTMRWAYVTETKENGVGVVLEIQDVSPVKYPT
jgi:hypothetical protein